MSRGGRGGSRGGAAGGGAGMRSHALPFDLDDDIEQVMKRGRVDEKSPEEAKKLFPPFPDMVDPAPITDAERALVQIERDILAQRRAGPFWTGSREQWEEFEAQSGRYSENFDPFDSAASYGKRGVKRAWRPADLRRVKLERRFFPRELWDVVDGGEESKGEGVDGGQVAKRQKKLGLTKSVVDKLAKFDEGAEAADEADEEEDEEKVDGEDGDGEDFDRDLRDDTFDDDLADDDDYNAEQYFDGGDEDFDEGGGDDYGEDGY